jgi:hypothetical protein
MGELLPITCRNCIYFRTTGDFDSRDVWCEKNRFGYEDLPGGLFGTLPAERNLTETAGNCPDFTPKSPILLRGTA